MQLRDDKSSSSKALTEDEDMPITKALANTSLEGSRRRAHRMQNDSSKSGMKINDFCNT
jgi:hypothetical protein